jgi:hypothetical protein
VAGDEVMHAPHGDDSAAACAHSRESLRWGSAQRSQQACRQDQESRDSSEHSPARRHAGRGRQAVGRPRQQGRCCAACAACRLRMQQRVVRAAPALGQSTAQLAGIHAGAGKQQAGSGRPRQQGRGDAMLRRMRRLQQISGESLETRQSCPCAGAEHSPDSRHTGRDRQAAGRLRQAQAAGAR